ERRPDSNRYRCAVFAAITMNPLLLLRRPDTDEHEIRLSFADHAYDVRILFLIALEAVARRIRTDDLNAGECLPQTDRRLRGHPFGSPEEEQPIAAADDITAKLGQDVRAGNPRLQRLAQQLRRPDDRHAIRDDGAGLAVDLSEMFILLQLHNMVDIASDDIGRLADPDHLVD